MNFDKVLIANRGEIALRILRACKQLGLKTVAVHSTADRELMHVKLADETICIGPASPKESYLNIPTIIAAAEAAGNPEHEGIYFDGASHYFIDGAVQETGKLLCLAYDEKNGRYYELLRTDRSPGKRNRIYGELKPLGK